MNQSLFRLKIQQVQQVSCLFELSWDRGKQICATLPYPQILLQLYGKWQKAYLNYYKTSLRARVAETGKITPSPEDWYRQLVETEAKLLSEFYLWLRRHELFELRREIAHTAQRQPLTNTDIFLTCNSLELEKLPWESWDITSEFVSNAKVRLIRTPINIRGETASIKQIRRSRVRILAILGDDTGLNLHGDKKALEAIEKLAEIEFFTCQTQQTSEAIKKQIQTVLTDARGWDMLFFAGHSNETDMTGGELAIAPGVSITIKEILPQLKIAQSKGLKFALFNSCNGLSLANSLIDLGLSQVIVMREPIHNQVAQVFLIEFLQALAEFKDVHDALIVAQDHLQRQNLTYPSAYLIPSLFAHPDASLFRIKPQGWQEKIKQWFPTPQEAIAVSALAIMSLMPSVESWLLQSRIFTQSLYRDLTGQIPPVTQPPVLLVQIDETSIRKAGISDPLPMSRRYIAQIVDKLATLDTQIIGIDYLFDRQQPGQDLILASSIRDAINEQASLFVFAAILNAEGEEIAVEPQTGIAKPNWSLQGYTNALPQYIRLPLDSDCQQTCPFAYLLATVATLQDTEYLPQPQLNNADNLRMQIFDSISDNNNQQILWLQNARVNYLTYISQLFGQYWLRPIIDFSLPPDLVYEGIPAWQLLDDSEKLDKEKFRQQIVIIAPGGYNEAGVTSLGSDNFPVPPALAYWRSRFSANTSSVDKYTGSEAHAYMIHHLLTQRLVIPIPNLWMIMFTVILGKGVVILVAQQNRQEQRLKIVCTCALAVYGLVGLQIYIAKAILFPWLLPSTTFLVYIWFFARNNYAQ